MSNSTYNIAQQFTFVTICAELQRHELALLPECERVGCPDEQFAVNKKKKKKLHCFGLMNIVKVANYITDTLMTGHFKLENDRQKTLLLQYE